MSEPQDFREKRDFVRASLTFDVKFRVVDKEEYELSLKKISQLAPQVEESQYIDGHIDTAQLENAGLDRELIKFLIHLNDKLDNILSAVSKDTSETIRFHKGTAVDIGGAGMKMAVESPVRVGEFVHIQLVLSRQPLMHIDVYGQVVRVDAPSGGSGGFYYLGIKFSDLDVKTREQLIASIFKRQRQTLRERAEECPPFHDSED
ncbi:MAG: PilZ domain-containing protein [Desulfotignum sp.]|nr:PilZ domain-containing protein [Desulfotignum sp.]MCF8088444.1 PilZ domain-containing protein [Desulfotignum sp.]MCF8136445.1 PilZ domain-containing protein [Desulfotignum sp.]